MFLLDTNVVSELRKARAGKAHPNVAAWAARQQSDTLFLSVVVVQELEIDVLQRERKDIVQGAILRIWLDDHVLPAFADRILPIDVTIARRSASLHVPDQRPYRDGLIAATALTHGMTVVTRNVEDFAATSARLLNPWEEPPGL